MSELAPQRIVCAAIRKGGVMICGARHLDNVMRDQIRVIFDEVPTGRWIGWEQGFIDQFCNFLTRREAWVIASREGQIRQLVGSQSSQDEDERELDSSNLY